MKIGGGRIFAVAVAAMFLIATTFAEGAEQLVDVVATGYGMTVREATKAALRSAVEQVVGTMVDATTLVENDKLIEEEILSYSAGMIASSKIVGEPKKSADGIYTVKVKASVKKTRLEGMLRSASAVNVTLDGADLFARMTAAKDDLADAEAMIKGILAKHIDCVVAEAVPGRNGTSPIDLDPKNGEIFANVRVRIDQAKYVQFAKEIVEKLGMIAELKTEVMDIGHENGYRPDGWFKYNVPKAYMDRNERMINTLVVMKSFRTGLGVFLRFDKNVAKAIVSNLSIGTIAFEVKLLDSMGEVMASNQKALVYGENVTMMSCVDKERLTGAILPVFDISPGCCGNSFSPQSWSSASDARDKLIKEGAVSADVLYRFEHTFGCPRNGFLNGLIQANYRVRLGQFTPDELKSVGRLEINVGHIKGSQFLEQSDLPERSEIDEVRCRRLPTLRQTIK